MPRTARLTAWLLLVVGLLPAQLAWLYLLRGSHVAGRESTLIFGQLLLGAAAIGMLVLLRTTPHDAIRLSPRASVALVAAGAALLQFAAVALLGPSPADDRHAVLLRAALSCCAVAAVTILAIALRRTGESPWHAALLGWNPLLTLEVGGTGHADAIGVCLLAGALAAAADRRFKLGAVALALACAVKPSAALLLPFVWRQAHEQRSFRAGRRVVLVFAATAALAYVAVQLYPDRSDHPGGRASVRAAGSPSGNPTHGSDGASPSRSNAVPAEGNALVYESFQSLFGDGGAGPQTERAKDAARLIGVLVILAMGLFLWQSRATPAEAAYWLFLPLLLFAPAAPPCRLVWPLVALPLLRGPQGFAALTWCATAAICYARPPTADAPIPPQWLIAEYLPVLCVLAVEVLRLARLVPLNRAVQTAPRPVPA